MANGQILAWLNSDDTYLPGAIRAAVEALDKSKGRYIVMGECPFIDEEGNPTGVFHPSAYRGRRHLIKIWKGLYSIPQPTVFFYRELIDEFGGLDESLYFAMDYDLWLRFNKKYSFFSVKKPLATYRLHKTSKTMEISDEELLRRTVEISSKYWGPRHSPAYWYYRLSYRLSQIFLWRIASRYWNLSANHYTQRNWFRTAFYLLLAVLIYPPTILRKKYVFSHLIKTYISSRIGSHFDRFMLRPDPNKCDGKAHGDGWVSDFLSLPLEITPSVKYLEIVGDAYLKFFDNSPLSMKVFLNDSFIEEQTVEQSGEFRIPVDLRNHDPSSPRIEIRLYPDKVFIPRVLGEGSDKRRLSFVYKGVVLHERGVPTDSRETQATRAVNEYVQRLKHDHDLFMSELSANAEAIVKNYLEYYKIVPEEYIRRFLSHIEQNHMDNPLAALYVESELGAPMRMLELIRVLKGQGYDVNGKSVLDIGCSNGALLLACHEHGATNLVGVDLDERRLESGRLLVGEKKITLLNRDILSEESLFQLGTFNAIFATDVLEYILDPNLLFVRMKRLLSSAEESFAFLSVFNKYSFRNIRSEPHYDIPGMILLAHDVAKELWYEVRDAMHSTLEYEVGNWHSFEEYSAMADKAGLDLVLLGNETFDVPERDFEKTIVDLGQEVWQRIEALPATEKSKQRLHEALEDYCKMHEDDHRRSTMEKYGPSVFYNKYYRQPVYMLCRHKRGSPNR